MAWGNFTPATHETDKNRQETSLQVVGFRKIFLITLGGCYGDYGTMPDMQAKTVQQK